MQTARIVQAVALMLVVALAASCTVTKEYTSKLFAPRTPSPADTQALALRFLDTDPSDTDPDGWVTTDIIMGRDTSDRTTALDNFAKVFPAAKASPLVKDTTNKPIDSINTAAAPVINEEKVLARNYIQNGSTREKKSRE